ncbi:KR domain-containing protein [Colletotrichum sublineola]|nr:KR domain-containing protein [Colletotrichum sublineola]
MATHKPSNDMETRSGCQNMVTLDGDPVVICGMAMRLPGGVSNSEQLWELLLQKRCASVPIPGSRFNLEGYYSRHPRPGTMHFEKAYILDHVDLDRFDSCHFPFSRKEVEQMDPAQRMLLEITWECLENAGEMNWQGKAVGCYVGSFAEDWTTEMERDTQYFDHYPAGKWDFMLSNRISYVYDFRGPSMTIRTGCSGTLVALNLAEQAVKSGECSSAIIAGCSMFLSGPIATKGSFGTVGATVSPQGICKTFDADCDGLGRGEAVNAIYVKRLSHALRDGNPIRAVIRSTATQHDGSGSGMLIPNGHAQESLIRHTYDIAGIRDFSKTAFFECHGTGTVVGDPIEVAAVERIFGEYGILIGSAKPNFGHSEGAAALTSIIKATLMLERETIVPNANFEKPNPNISWANGLIKVPTKVQPFPVDRCKRISVNAFGMGGTNTHVILEAYENKDSHINTTSSEESHLLLFSASNPKSLELLQQAYMQYIRERSPNMADLAYTLGIRRSKMAYRSFIIANNKTQSAEPENCGHVVKPKTRQVVFVFNGQGTHWATMGKVLVETSPVFLKCIRRLDTALRNQLPQHLRPSWTIEAELVKDKAQSRFEDSEYAQTCCTAVQIGITDVLRSWSVLPDAISGHSSGEIAGAYAAGVLTAETAIIVAYFRGTVPKRTGIAEQKGTMAAVMLGSDKIANYLVDEAVVACENSQSRTTISGDQSAVEATVGKVKADGILAKTLNVGFAYHSPHMLPCGPEYEKAIRPFVQSTSTAAPVPFFSSVTGRYVADPTVLADAKYWHQSLVQPVRFHDALRGLLESLGSNRSQAAHPVIVEIGARPALQGPIKEILGDFPDMTASWVPTLEPKSNDGSLLRVAGRLFCEHVNMDYSAFTPPGKTLADVPPYTWAHDESFTAEHRLMKAYQESKFPMHDLLGRRVFETSALEPAWRKVLNIQDVPWLADHVIDGLCIFPFTGYLSIAEEALRQVTPGGVLDSFEARDFIVTKPLQLDPGTPVEIHTRLRRLGDGDATSYSVQITSWKNNIWTEQCHALVRAGPFPHRPLRDIKRSVFPREISSKFWYNSVQRRGYTYGPTFRGIDNITASPSEMAATACVHCLNNEPAGHYLIHPSATDQCMQMMGIAYCHGLPRHAKYGYRPTSVRHIFICRHESNMSFWATGTAEVSTLNGKLSGTVRAYTNDGRELMTMSGIEATPTVNHVKSTGEMPLLSTVKWHDSATFYPFHKLQGTSEEYLAKVMSVLTHTNPQLRILEIGTGSDTTTTEWLLKHLRPTKGRQMFSEYQYAGLSSEGCEKAKDSLGDVDGLEVKSWPSVANDSSNIHGYDVIISNNASQGLTEKLEEYLTLAKTLLRPTGAGVLILFEMLQDDEGVAFIKESEPKESDILSALRHAGFDLSWKNESDRLRSPLTLRPLLADVPQHIHIIEPNEKYLLVDQFKSDLSTTSITFQETAMDNIPPGKDPLVFFLDLAGPYPYNLSNSPEAFVVFMSFIELLLKSQRPMVWVTSPCHQGDCKDARYAMIHGFARTLHHEVKDDITVIEVDTKAGDPKIISKALLRIVRSLPHRRFGDVFGPPDAEIAIVQGDSFKIPRLQWTTTEEELSLCASQGSGSKSFAKLALGKPQDVSSLQWVNYPLPDAVGPDETRVEVEVASVSKHDLNSVRATIDTRFLSLGQEGAGIVKEVGSGVQDFHVGDRVAFLANSAVASHLDIASANCLRLADDESLEDAASLPLARVTAYLCVVEFGKVEKGATVLLPFVKSLAFLTTVQQLKMIGANLYFTIQSSSHRSLLENGLQIPSPFILSDGDLENGPLSNLRADYIIAFGGQEPRNLLLRCLSSSGTFLDVLSEPPHLVNEAAPPLQGSQAYRLVQVYQLLQAKPQLMAKALHESQGYKLPFASGKTFEAEQYREALQATSFDFGHAVLRLPTEKARKQLLMSGSATGLCFRPDASYILVGGLGGLGRTVATWMVEKGAKELIFLSRSAGEGPDTAAFLGELRSQGCDVKTVAGSVVNPEDLIRTIRAAGKPIAGVFQMSMVLGDRALSKMTLQFWVESIAAKVDGTLRLHEALLDHDLDFFVMFSSLSGIVGQIGQLSYNAANTFLDGFAHYRHCMGLAASVVDIGVMGDVGVAARMDGIVRKAEADGCCILNEQDLLGALEVSILHSRPQGSSNNKGDKTQIVLGLWTKRPITDPSTHVLWKRDARMSGAYTYNNQRHVSKDSQQEDTLETIVRIARTDPSQLRKRATVDLITKVLIDVLSESLARPGIELRPFTILDELGLDSLNTSQLRDWITQYLFVDLPFHEIIRSETVQDLADKVSELMDAEFVMGRQHGNG